jgi:hypothetical protein
MSKPKIYCYIYATSDSCGGLVHGRAIAEDGTILTQHTSSSQGFAERDLGHLPGTFQELRHAKFAEHYPDGFETVWVDDPKNHEGLRAAIAQRKDED